MLAIYVDFYINVDFAHRKCLLQSLPVNSSRFSTKPNLTRNHLRQEIILHRITLNTTHKKIQNAY